MLPYPADLFPTAALTSEFPSLTNAPTLLRSMNAQPLFEQGQPGKPSQNFAALLERIQLADPTSPDFDEDNKGQGWGHYQFTAGGLNLSSSLTSWQDVGSIAFAFQLVAAAIKTCRDTRLMCANAGKSTVVGFISDAFLQETLDALKRCWIGAGGVSACLSYPIFSSIHYSRLLPPSLLLTPNVLLLHLHIARLQSHLRASSRSNSSGRLSQTFSAIPQPILPLSSSPLPTQNAHRTLLLKRRVFVPLIHLHSLTTSQDDRADESSLKLLQVPELVAWVSDKGLTIPKWKRKDGTLHFHPRLLE